jgi:hypothetical protein
MFFQSAWRTCRVGQCNGIQPKITPSFTEKDEIVDKIPNFLETEILNILKSSQFGPQSTK